ncbi:MAG: family 43 glycosylhydrolase [Prevotella sp.]|nr:family 43 glycosylhydrolase [Prevotella sp.]
MGPATTPIALAMGLLLVLVISLGAAAQNPIVQTWYTSDPAPMVAGDRLYVYTGHDEDNADFCWMYEWRAYSTTDMVNWTDHGTLLNLNSFSWADDRAWAAQCIERNGKFYWYVCAHSKLTNGMAIGVAVADSPTGPFRDALGRPLYDDGSWDNIDPTVFIDNNNGELQAWLFWGNPTIHYAKLNEDMLSFDGEVSIVNQTVEGFGSPNFRERQRDVSYEDCYTEGPWILRRDITTPAASAAGLAKRAAGLAKKAQPLYYLLYAAGGVPEHIAYSTAPSFEGPWTYRGTIMPQEDTRSFTNHCGVVDYKGHSYFFYHTGKLPGGGGFGRSAAVEEFTYNADGTFPTIHHTDEGVSPIGTLSPYQRVEAETMAFSLGVHTEANDQTGVFVSDIQNGDYIKVREVDFGQQSPASFTATAASALQGGRIEVRLDSLGGQQVALMEVPHTGGWEQWRTLSAPVQQPVTGKHDVFFAFTGYKGCKLFNFDWWKFNQ